MLRFGDYAKTMLAGSTDCCVECLVGRDIQLTIAGLTNGTCSACSTFNKSYVMGPLVDAGNCCVGIGGSFGNFIPIPGGASTTCVSSAHAWPWCALKIGKTAGSIAAPYDWSMVYTAQFNAVVATWELNGADARAAIVDLCKANTISVPFITQFSGGITACAGGVPCTSGTAVSTTVPAACVVNNDLSVQLV